jgi:nitrogen fixation/metabolism regulation signal transduction histidine kinase
MIMKTVLITGSIAVVVVLCVTLLTLFGPNTVASQYVKFAIMLVLFLVILIGSYWFVMVPSGRNGRRENPTDRDAEGGTPREP